MLKINLLELVMSLSSAIDLIDDKFSNHHKRVAYISFNIGKELGLTEKDLLDLIIAGSLHDIGALSIKERLDLLNFEAQNPERHAEIGYLLLNNFEPFSQIAHYIRYHHTNYEDIKFQSADNISIMSHILHLADRIEVLIDKKINILNQINEIKENINKYKFSKFNPEIVDVFNNLAQKESFWLDITYQPIEKLFYPNIKSADVNLNINDLLSITKIFSQIIDFRSKFTASHSSGVAASAKKLAELAGFTQSEIEMMEVAGYLHDIGKLAVPNEILEKNGKLTEEEFNIIKTHTYYTRKILDNINGFNTINDWASLHHERIDGKGYPFHYKAEDLSIGSRILAVADVFTAVTEDRPYRNGMEKHKVIELLNKMAKKSMLDLDIVNLLINNYDRINTYRINSQIKAEKGYKMFIDMVASYN